MDINRLSQGQLIAAGSAIVLFILTFIPWIGGEGVDDLNLWKSTSTLDIYILLLAVLVVGPALMAATGGNDTLPFTGATVTFVLGAIAVILVFFFLIGPVPSFGAEGDAEVDKKIGLWLGLLASLGVAVGGYMAMEGERVGGVGRDDRVGPG